MRRLLVGPAAALAAMLSLVAVPATAHAESPNGPITLWDNIRYGTGAWQGWIQPQQPPGGMSMAFAVASDASDVHVDELNGGLWDNIRYGNGGTWQGWREVALPAANVNELAEADAANGDIWFVVGGPSGLYFNVRHSDTGRWGGWAPVDGSGAVPGNGTLGTFAVAINGYNELQLILWTGGGALYHTEFNIGTSTWQNWQMPAQPPSSVLSVAAVGLDDGSTQFLVTSQDNHVYHDIRNANGTWQGWRATSMPSPTGGSESACCAGAIMSAAADLDGNVQFLLTYEDTGNNDRHITYHNIRSANGTWQGWRELLNAGSYCEPKITEQAFDYEDDEAHVDEFCGDYNLWP
jgi:hypothetical protein